jgi:serine/threonine protein phosphatase PrpC
MEDAHAVVLDLDGPGESNAFFAVYDGHGGVFLSSTIFDFRSSNFLT